MVEIGRVWDPTRKKYIRIVEGGVPSKWDGCYDPGKHRIHLRSRESYTSDCYMDTCIHEVLHAVFPHLSEEIVLKKTPIMKRLLLKMGVQPVNGD